MSVSWKENVVFAKQIDLYYCFCTISFVRPRLRCLDVARLCSALLLQYSNIRDALLAFEMKQLIYLMETYNLGVRNYTR